MSSGNLVHQGWLQTDLPVSVVAIGLTIMTLVASLLLIVVYRLTLHPLRKVPGPFLAAATGAYEAYFQLVKDGGGRYWVEIERLHGIYGPIVRISPWEVHIKDSDWNDIYKLSSRAHKPFWHYQALGTTLSVNTAGSDTIHRGRRLALTPWFSTQHVARNAQGVQENVDILHDRLLSMSGKVANLSDAYRALSVDVATGFAFRQSFGNLEEAEFSHEFNEAVKTYGRTGIVNRHFFGIPFAILRSLPDAWIKKMNPAVYSFQSTVRNCALRSINRAATSDKEAQDMVQSMLASDLPREEKAFDRVLAECRGVVLGGQETTATVLSSVTYNLLTHPEMLARLRKELEDAQRAKGSRLEYQDIDSLPYVTAMLNESHRTCNSVSGRLSRISEAADLHYKQYSLPRGTYISVSMHDTHMDPSIYAEPEKYIPDRWLVEADSKRLLKYLQPWGRGARTCLGMELANTDLRLTIARLFGPDRGFEMKLYDTTLRDWDAYGDYMAPIAAPGGKGLRVTIEPREK